MGSDNESHADIPASSKRFASPLIDVYIGGHKFHYMVHSAFLYQSHELDNHHEFTAKKSKKGTTLNLPRENPKEVGEVIEFLLKPNSTILSVWKGASDISVPYMKGKVVHKLETLSLAEKLPALKFIKGVDHIAYRLAFELSEEPVKSLADVKSGGPAKSAKQAGGDAPDVMLVPMAAPAGPLDIRTTWNKRNNIPALWPKASEADKLLVSMAEAGKGWNAISNLLAAAQSEVEAEFKERSKWPLVAARLIQKGGRGYEPMRLRYHCAALDAAKQAVAAPTSTALVLATPQPAQTKLEVARKRVKSSQQPATLHDVFSNEDDNHMLAESRTRLLRTRSKRAANGRLEIENSHGSEGSALDATMGSSHTTCDSSMVDRESSQAEPIAIEDSDEEALRLSHPLMLGLSGKMSKPLPNTRTWRRAIQHTKTIKWITRTRPSTAVETPSLSMKKGKSAFGTSLVGPDPDALLGQQKNADLEQQFPG
ncbi:MAG: hypothetical protein Q9207_006049 [Kuettlingeria erythrocarpa]